MEGEAGAIFLRLVPAGTLLGMDLRGPELWSGLCGGFAEILADAKGDAGLTPSYRDSYSREEAWFALVKVTATARHTQAHFGRHGFDPD